MFDWLKNLTGGNRPPARGPDELPPPSEKVRQLTSMGQAIDAIKLYRNQNPGVGLAEAKSVIDALRG